MGKYADTRSNNIGGIVVSDDAAHYSTAFQGGLIVGHEASCALDNVTAITNLFIAYADAGRSTENDWKFSFTRLDAKVQKPVNSLREFNIGESLASYSTPNLTWGTTVATGMYIVKIFVPAADTATLTHCTLSHVAGRTSSTTVLPLTQGQNTFLVVGNGTNTDASIALTTGGATVQTSVHLVTAWTANQVMIHY